MLYFSLFTVQAYLTGSSEAPNGRFPKSEQPTSSSMGDEKSLNITKMTQGKMI